MKDYVSLGSSPLEEDCAQVGSPEYHERARIELREFKRMMNEIHPPVDSAPCWYAIKSFPHDFGSYSELCACYDDDSEEAGNWAFEAEGLTPEKWDEEARTALEKYPPVYLTPEERNTLKWMEER